MVSAVQAHCSTGSLAAMHLANFCFPDARFDAELASLSADILNNSWYANQVNKRAHSD